MGKSSREAFRNKVQGVLGQAVDQHFRGYLRWTPSRRDSIDIVANPLELGADKRTAEYRKLRTAQKKFIKSLQGDGGTSIDEQLGFPYS